MKLLNYEITKFLNKNYPQFRNSVTANEVRSERSDILKFSNFLRPNLGVRN